MPSPSATTWPTPGDSNDVINPTDIVWKTVKTEEEDYLDKLESKLSRIMENGSAVPSVDVENTHMDPDDLPDDVPNYGQPLNGDDPGLHLLYNFPPKDRSPSPVPSTHSESSPKTVARPRLVRFRSRVRIASGVHASTSASSSTCESVSSSISAPLRGLRHETPQRPAPLSSIFSDPAYAWLQGTGPARKSERERRRDAAPVDERSSLTSSSSPRVRAYTELNNEDEEDDAEYERMNAAARKSEEDVMFGRWPWRLINRHWWWWKLEPFTCCCARFDDESDRQWS